MKKTTLSFLVLALFGMIFNSCGHKPMNADEIPVNPYVEAFTSGNISRYSEMNIVFSEDIPEGERSAEELKKNIDISPSVDGDFILQNNHTVVFKPKTSFKRNTNYQVTVDIAAWFEKAKGKDKEFTFGFATMPFSIRSSFTSLDVSKGDENAYDITCTLMTSDKESPEEVENTVRLSEDVPTVQWQHSPDGKHHEIILRNVPSQDEARNLIVKVKKTDTPTEKLPVTVPAKNDFSIYDVRFVSEPSRYVEVTFTKNIDPSQSLEGLVSIEGNNDQGQTVKNNKVRLYPDNNKNGDVKVDISEGIRSDKGMRIAKSETRTVSVGGDLPMVKFAGDGVVVPTSNETMVPFQAVRVRGVVVTIMKIREQNIGQFLQINNLDGNEELARVGRLIKRKVIFLDEDPSNDLTKLKTYALDLQQLVKLEPGAIYRVELSFDRQLAITQCDSNNVKYSKEQILADNEKKFKELNEQFDNGEYYYSGGYADYNSEGNPCSDDYYNDKSIAKNVLASNLGVMVKGGGDGTMNVFIHNLLNTEPMKDVKVKFYNYQGDVLGEGETDSDGQAKVTLKAGSPFYLIASLDKQRAYVRMDKGSALSLSSFDVSGEVIQKGIKGFIYGDRGVWRPGDVLHMSFMLNDREGTLPDGYPVIMELYNPMGQIYLKRSTTSGILGVYAFDLPTESNVATGSWTVKVTAGGATFTKAVRIESIKPNRLKINITTPNDILLKGSSMDGNMHVEWLQGATARNLKYDIQGMFVSIPTTFKGFDKFCFDDPSKTFNSEEGNLITGRTDASGNARLTPTFDTGSAAPGMLMANFTTKVYEESGDFSIDTKTMRYSPYTSYVGIQSPQQDEAPLSTGKKYMYQVASVNYKGMPEPNRSLTIHIYKVDWYWWYNSDNSDLAQFVSNSYNQPIRNMNLTTDVKGRGMIPLSFADSEWGTYFIQVTDNVSKHTTGVLSYFDMPFEGRRNADGAESATMLKFKTDKDEYAPGEPIRVTFPSSEGSRAIVTVENGARVLSVTEQKCQAKETIVTLKATEEMQPNAYVYVTLLQPHAQTKNDLPIRLYGVVPIKVTAPDSRLTPVIQMANELKPQTKYNITVSEKSGQEMAYTLAVVDEGLLDLTHYKTPDPWTVFNAREALGVSTWDMYNYVLGAFGGRIEQIFSIGGDNALNKGPKAIVNRFTPVVQFIGPFHLGKGESKRHTLNMPNYYGRVRVMVVAGNGKAYGNAERSVMVRKPVMILGTLPRIIGVNEVMEVPATVFATQKGIGKVKVRIACSNNMQVIGSAIQTLSFSEKEDRTIPFRIRVKGTTGAAHVRLTAVGKGETSTYDTSIEIRSVLTPQAKVQAITLGRGRAWRNNILLPGADGTNRLTLEVSSVEPLNLSKHLSYLLSYPYGCIEQITSTAFPQIYLKQLATLTPAQQKSAENAVKTCISRQRAYQTAEGGFSYWPGETSTNAWGTVYAAHFLHEAEANGYYVPADMKRSVIGNMSRIARSWKLVGSYYGRSEEFTQAYRLYVLALMNAPEMGAMNRLKETKGTLSITRWLLSATYSLTGRNDVARSLTMRMQNVRYSYNEYDQTFGSPLRDYAIILQALVLQNRSNEAAAVARQISRTFAQNNWLSTQETSFGLYAISQFMRKYVTGKMSFGYTFKGRTQKITSNKALWMTVLADKTSHNQALGISNSGKSTLFVRVISEGVPAQGKERAYANGVAVSVKYTNMNGTPLNVANLNQGTNLIAWVTVKNHGTSGYQHLALTQIFPSGWEILNTRYMNEISAMTATSNNAITYQDIRDDRVYSYIDYLPLGKQVTVKINLCAAYAGSFYLPPVSCEAMYNHLVRANTEGRWVNVKR
jgi:uncharacterized protein YfaS (alpha-2-macroglobulin family)